MLDSDDRLSIRELVQRGVSWLADLAARILDALKAITPLALAAGCEGPPQLPTTQPKPAITLNKQAEPRSLEPTQLGTFNFTFYYVISETEIGGRARGKPANHNVGTEFAAVMPAMAGVTVYEPKKCSPIAEVSREFAAQLTLQGTGKLRDGRVLNIWGACSCGRSPCFTVTPTRWGTAGTGKALQPFRTVAVDPKVIKLGSLLYVPMLEGRTMPGRSPWGGYVHDGCVVADDTGGGIKGNQVDLFVGRRGWFFSLSSIGGSHAWARKVPVFDGSSICERKGRRVARKAAAAS